MPRSRSIVSRQRDNSASTSWGGSRPGWKVPKNSMFIGTLGDGFSTHGGTGWGARHSLTNCLIDILSLEISLMSTQYWSASALRSAILVPYVCAVHLRTSTNSLARGLVLVEPFREEIGYFP